MRQQEATPSGFSTSDGGRPGLGALGTRPGRPVATLHGSAPGLSDCLGAGYFQLLGILGPSCASPPEDCTAKLRRVARIPVQATTIPSTGATGALGQLRRTPPFLAGQVHQSPYYDSAGPADKGRQAGHETRGPRLAA